MEKDIKEIKTRLSPKYVVTTTAAFIVAISWSNFFNTLFESIARRYDAHDNGPVELGLRLAFALALTTLLLFIGHWVRLKIKEKRQKKKLQMLQ